MRATSLWNGGGSVGADGKSAYELAVQEGYSGTLNQWLASLEGSPGAVGPTGPAGPAGESYEGYSSICSNKDANGIFTTIDFKDATDTLRKKSVLSGGTSPSYTTRTVTYYASDGVTVTSTRVYTLTYDGDGDLLSEVEVV